MYVMPDAVFLERDVPSVDTRVREGPDKGARSRSTSTPVARTASGVRLRSVVKVSRGRTLTTVVEISMPSMSRPPAAGPLRPLRHESPGHPATVAPVVPRVYPEVCSAQAQRTPRTIGFVPRRCAAAPRTDRIMPLAARAIPTRPRSSAAAFANTRKHRVPSDLDTRKNRCAESGAPGGRGMRSQARKQATRRLMGGKGRGEYGHGGEEASFG